MGSERFSTTPETFLVQRQVEELIPHQLTSRIPLIVSCLGSPETENEEAGPSCDRAQGQRPFNSLDGESSSTETLNVRVLSRVTFLHPPPHPRPADSSRSFTTQPGLISAVLGGRRPDPWLADFSLGGEARPQHGALAVSLLRPA